MKPEAQRRDDYKKENETPQKNAASHLPLGTCWQTLNKTSVENHHPEMLGRLCQPETLWFNQPSQGPGKNTLQLFLKSSSRTMEIIVHLWATLLPEGPDLGVFANLTWACQSSRRPWLWVRWVPQLSPPFWACGISPACPGCQPLQGPTGGTTAGHAEGAGPPFRSRGTAERWRAIASCL